MQAKPQILNAVAGILFAAAPIPALSQGGPLTPPPGAPAPTMRSLDLVEPRTPLVDGAPGVTVDVSGQITINDSGSYYLTETLDIATDANGIRIEAEGVTVDLMGFAVRYTGTESARSAISVRSSNVVIQNGFILSTTAHDGSSFTPGGFFRGVNASSDEFQGITVRNLSIQGVRNRGISLEGTAHLIENCTVNLAGTHGIFATGPNNTGGLVRNCVVHQVGSSGIWARTVEGCRVDNAVFTGISAQTVTDSYATSLTDSGIFATRSVTGSHGETSSTELHHRGISAEMGVVTNSTGISSGGHGILARIVSGSHGTSSGSHSEESSGILAFRSVTDSHGESTASGGGHGILSDWVSGSRGRSSGTQGENSIGIRATTVTNSHGESTATSGGHGIQAADVSGSRGISHSTSNAMRGISAEGGRVAKSTGISSGGQGIFADVVNSSRGISSGTHGADSSGIRALSGTRGAVTDSFGESTASGGGHGIHASNVIGSSGRAATGALNGIHANMVTHSYGTRGSNETGQYGIWAIQANGSRLLNGENIFHKFNMPSD